MIAACTKSPQIRIHRYSQIPRPFKPIMQEQQFLTSVF